MRIKGEKKVGSNKGILYVAIILAVLAGVIWFVFMRSNVSTTETSEYFCDAEKVSGNKFKVKTGHFLNASCQTKEQVFRGKYACKCTQDAKYGMTKELFNVKPGSLIVVSVWKKEKGNNGLLVVSADKNALYKSSKNVNQQRDGWQQIVYSVEIPDTAQFEKIVIFPYNSGGNDPVYFDDLKIQIFSEKSKAIEQNYEGHEFGIRVTNDNYFKLNKKRKEAFDEGLLFASKADLIPADIKIDDIDYKAEIRLKGDLLDHLKGDKWSFRVQLKGKKTWNGLGVFSIHNSQARAHVAEWLMHQLFKEEGIITPDYDFIEVAFNKKKLGVYAYEQHFDNNLLAYNNRIIGPILRHNDDAYWDNVHKNLSPFDWTNATQIELYNKENESRAGFVDLLDHGRSMLTDFLAERKTVTEVFDLEKIAKYFALLEISHALHAQQLTNIRFYMDPMSGKIEPIGFDCFGDHLPNVNKDWTAMGEGLNSRSDKKILEDRGDTYQVLLFQDQAFVEKYLFYLEKFSSDQYLDKKKNQFSGEIESRVNYIKTDKDYADYSFNWDGLFNKGKFTHNKLLPKENLSLVAYTENSSRDQLMLNSFHPFPLEVVAYDNNGQMEALEKPIVLEAFNNKVPVRNYELSLKQTTKILYFKTLGIDSVFSLAIPKVNKPIANVPLIKADINELKNLTFLSVNKNNIDFKPGALLIKKPIIIPAEYNVNIPSGTNIKFTGKGCILSYSPIIAIGSAAAPIVFEGDGSSSSNAIFISATEKVSIFKYCQFLALSQFSLRNIQGDGGINLYRTKSKFENCRIRNARGRDALTAVYSNYEIKDCQIINNRSDAIDMSYSSANISALKIESSGADGIEISGGQLNGNNIQISKSVSYAIKADKGAAIYIAGLGVKESTNGLYANEGAKVKLINVNFDGILRAMEILSTESLTTEVKFTNYKSLNVIEEYALQENAILTINGSKKRVQ